jgi:DNA-directed RNA polymerase subunit RPC12/RpoP
MSDDYRCDHCGRATFRTFPLRVGPYSTYLWVCADCKREADS